MAATWTPLAGAYNSVKGVMATTEAAPASQAQDGVSLVNVGAYTLYAECDAGQSFLGTGSFLSYVWDPLVDWAFTADLILAVPATASGNRRIAFADRTVNNVRGRLAHIANGVGVTGGQLTLYYICTALKGFNA